MGGGPKLSRSRCRGAEQPGQTGSLQPARQSQKEAGSVWTSDALQSLRRPRVASPPCALLATSAPQRPHLRHILIRDVASRGRAVLACLLQHLSAAGPGSCVSPWADLGSRGMGSPWSDRGSGWRRCLGRRTSQVHTWAWGWLASFPWPQAPGIRQAHVRCPWGTGRGLEPTGRQGGEPGQEVQAGLAQASLQPSSLAVRAAVGGVGEGLGVTPACSQRQALRLSSSPPASGLSPQPSPLTGRAPSKGPLPSLPACSWGLSPAPLCGAQAKSPGLSMSAWLLGWLPAAFVPEAPAEAGTFPRL